MCYDVQALCITRAMRAQPSMCRPSVHVPYVHVFMCMCPSPVYHLGTGHTLPLSHIHCLGLGRLLRLVHVRRGLLHVL